MKKSYWILIGLFIVLVTVFLLMTFVFNKNTTVTDLPKLEIPDRSLINYITIQNGKNGELLKFIKVNDDEWDLNYREKNPIKGKAEDYIINKLLDDIRKVTLKGIKTRKVENYIKYEIDDDSGIFVEVSSDKGNTVTEFIIGGNDINEKYTYIRLPEYEPVYNTLGAIRMTFNKPLNDYRDKTIFDYEYENIVKIECKTDEEDKILVKSVKTVQVPIDETDENSETEEKQVDEWKDSITKELYDTEKVKNAINQISKLSTSSFMDYPSDEYLSIEPIFEVTYYENEASNKVYNVKVLKYITSEEDKAGTTRDKYLIQIGEQTNPLYLVNKTIIENLIKLKDIGKPVEEEID